MCICAPWCEPFTGIRTCKVTKWETSPSLGVHDVKTLPRIRSCNFTKWKTFPRLNLVTGIRTCYITKWEAFLSIGVNIVHNYKMGNVPKSWCLDHAHLQNGKLSQVSMCSCAPWCDPLTRIRTCEITKWETFPRLAVHDGKTLPRIRSCKPTKWETFPSLNFVTRTRTCYITKWETFPSLGV